MRIWVALILLAGCLQGNHIDTGLDCDVACNMQATVDPITRQANELSIAVNPTNPDNIVVSGKDYTPNQAGDCVWDGIYVTFDGGKTWDNANLAGSNWARLNDPSAPIHPEFSRFWCATDPVLAFAADGTLYWSVMPYQCDAATGSKAGREIPGTGQGLPEGGLNDWFWSCSSMYVLVSHDGGATWPTARELAFGPRLEHDKQWMSIADDGRVLVCWDRDPSYQATGALDNPAAQLSEPGYMVCSISADKGESWSDVTDANPDWDGFLPWIDWHHNVAWLAGIDATGTVFVTSSDDGLEWDDPTKIGTYSNPPAGGDYGWPVLPGNNFRTFALPTLAVDRSGGPFDGNRYVAWFNFDDLGEISFAAMQDGSLLTQRLTGDNHRFMPVLSVGPDGTVDLIWYERTEGVLFDLFYAYSLDGGVSFSSPLRVSEVSSNETMSHHQNGMVFIGDYNDMDSTCGSAYPVWMDTRNGKADAFIAKIDRPSVISC